MTDAQIIARLFDEVGVSGSLHRDGMLEKVTIEIGTFERPMPDAIQFFKGYHLEIRTAHGATLEGTGETLEEAAKELDRALKFYRPIFE